MTRKRFKNLLNISNDLRGKLIYLRLNFFRTSEKLIFYFHYSEELPIKNPINYIDKYKMSRVEYDSDSDSDDEPMIIVSQQQLAQMSPQARKRVEEQMEKNREESLAAYYSRPRRRYIKPTKPSNFPDFYEHCRACVENLEKCEECAGWDALRVYEYEQSIKQPQRCAFCFEEGHYKEECPALKYKKERLCPYCGLYGHGDQPEKKCQKIKLGPQGQVGFCTWKECRQAKDQWGHYMVTCPKRKASQGPYKFKPGENPRLAYAPPKPIKK